MPSASTGFNENKSTTLTFVPDYSSLLAALMASWRVTPLLTIKSLSYVDFLTTLDFPISKTSLSGYNRAVSGLEVLIKTGPL